MDRSAMDNTGHMERARYCASRVSAQRTDALKKMMIGLCLASLRKAVNRGRS